MCACTCSRNVLCCNCKGVFLAGLACMLFPASHTSQGPVSPFVAVSSTAVTRSLSEKTADRSAWKVKRHNLRLECIKLLLHHAGTPSYHIYNTQNDPLHTVSTCTQQPCTCQMALPYMCWWAQVQYDTAIQLAATLCKHCRESYNYPFFQRRNPIQGMKDSSDVHQSRSGTIHAVCS